MVRRLTLAKEERERLETAVRQHPKAYVRERAAAIVKIADGATAARVAEHGLLRRHAPDTVYRWLDRYREAGLDGLLIRPGRGRPPTLSPPRARRAGAAAGRVGGAVGERPA